MKRARRIVLSLLTVLLFVCSFSISIAAEDNGVSMLSSEMLSKFKVVSTEIMTGTDKGFEETKTLTRAEVATIIIRLSGYLDGEAEGITLDDVDYGDVPADHWAKDYIALATKLGLVRGTGNGNFSPDDLVTIQEVETMVCRAIGAAEYIDAQGEWPQNYMDFSHEHGIDEYITKIGPDDSLRINTAVIIANVLDLLRGHVETKADGSKAWVFDQKSVAEDNLGVRLVVNKTCSSVKSGSFNGITVKEGVDLSIVKSGEKYDYYINDKNVIVGIWPSSLKEEAKKEQELIDKGIDPHTLLGDKDQQQEQKEEKTKKRSSGPAGPAVISMYSITKAPTISFDETKSKDVFEVMKITGTTSDITTHEVGDGSFNVVYSLTDDTKYIFKGTDISLANLQARSNYSLITNTEGVSHYVQLADATFDNAQEPTKLTLKYLQMPSVIWNNQIDSYMQTLSAGDDNLANFLGRGVRVKSLDATNKIIVFETIGDGIYFDDTKDHYIDTLPLTGNVVVYAKVSENKRQLEVKWGTLVDLNDPSVVTKKVAYTAYQRVDLPKLDLEKVNQTPVKDEREFTDVKQTEVFEITPKKGDTFKDRSGNKQLTPEILTNSGTGVETDATSGGAKLLSVRVIVEYDDENDKYKVTVVSFGQSLGDISSSILPASMSAEDKFTLPVINNANIATTTAYETKAVEPGETITVKYKVNNDDYSFNKATVLDKTTLTTDSTNGKVTDNGASVYAKLEESKYDPKEDAYNVTFKIYPVEISQATVNTKASLGASNALTVPKLDNFTRDKDADTFTFLNVDEPYVVTYTPRDHFKVKSGAVTAQGISSNNAEPYDLLTNAGSNLNVRMSVEVSETDNKVTVTFTPERKLAGDISTKASLANNELTLPVVDNAKAYVLNEEQEYVEAAAKTFTDGGQTYTVYYKPEDFYTFKDVELTATSETAGKGFVTYNWEKAGDPAANTRLSSADSSVTVGLTVSHDTTNDMYKVVFTSYKKKIDLSSQITKATFSDDNKLNVATISTAPIVTDSQSADKATIKIDQGTENPFTVAETEITADKTQITVTYQAQQGYTFEGANLTVKDLIGYEDGILSADNSSYFVYTKILTTTPKDKLKVQYTAYEEGTIIDDMSSGASDGDWGWPYGNGSGSIKVSFTPNEKVVFSTSKNIDLVAKGYGSYYDYSGYDKIAEKAENSNHKLTVYYGSEVGKTSAGSNPASLSDSNVFTPLSVSHTSVGFSGSAAGTVNNGKCTITSAGTNAFVVTYTLASEACTNGYNYFCFDQDASDKFTTSEFDGSTADGKVVGPWPADYYLEVSKVEFDKGKDANVDGGSLDCTNLVMKVTYNVVAIVKLEANTDVSNAPVMTNENVFTPAKFTNATYKINNESKDTLTVQGKDEIIQVEYAPSFGYKFTDTTLTMIKSYMSTTFTTGIIGAHGDYNVSFVDAKLSNDPSGKGNLILTFKAGSYSIIGNQPPVNLTAVPAVSDNCTAFDNIMDGVTKSVKFEKIEDTDNYKLTCEAKDKYNFDTPSAFVSAISIDGYSTSVGTGTNNGTLILIFTKK